MAISVQPVDGLINRLLQQNGKHSPVAKQTSPTTMGPKDQISISSSANKAQTPSTESQLQLQNKPGERALESHLLNLYRKNDNYGG